MTDFLCLTINIVCARSQKATRLFHERIIEAAVKARM
jgi:hypothetical protein